MGQDVNLARKIAVQNVGFVFAYFCGGHKITFRYDFVAPLIKFTWFNLVQKMLQTQS